MSVFKCKMCGGNIEFNPGDTVGVCDSCGTKQTLPTADDEVITNLHNRANTLRLKCEFDKAEEIYNKILMKNPNDAEAHWGIILCKYGIEYVEDPKTYERVPTCHRTSFDAILADEDYKSALANGDGAQRELYEAEAKKIDRIQKEILGIVKNEKPFDVFICYKETDENGKRTQDSAIANDIYYQLTQEGFKVFYAAITLEDKVGREYEPYIFAALNSAKVMLVVGSKPEYFTAVWVKNEWSRFLKLMKTDRSKLLIPCYRNMDAYELPEEFAHLQAQDMSKIGFINDIVRGIKKVVADSAPKAEKETVVIGGGGNVSTLLERAFIFLEDGKWNDADIYCEKVLDIDPKNAKAYLGKLMAELNVSSRKDLANCENPFDGSDNFNKALRFGDQKLAAELEGYIAHINERNEHDRLEGIYGKAEKAMNEANTEAQFKEAAGLFDSISEYRDAKELHARCLEKAEDARKDAIYYSAKKEAEKDDINSCRSAMKTFQSILGWRDSEAQISACMAKIERLKEEAERKVEAEHLEAEEHRIAVEKKKKKAKKVFIAIASVACVCVVAFLILLKTVIIPKYKLNKATQLIESGDYDSAYELLEEIGDNATIVSSKYDRAVKYIDSGDYDSAYELLEEIGDNETIASNKYDRAVKYIDSGDYDSAYELLEEIGDNATIASSKYDRAIKYIDSGDYKTACILLDGLSYKDSAEKFQSAKQVLIKKAKVGDIVYFGTYEQDNDATNGKENIEWLVLAKKGNRILVVSDKALDCKPYQSRDYVIWETCSLRKWLNNDFINTAFTAEERAKIPTVTVSADKNPEYSTDPGNATKDKVFLLSIVEAEKYFTSDEARMCVPTVYAMSNGLLYTSGRYSKDGDATCSWWLRSPGFDQIRATSVSCDGSVFRRGGYVYGVDSAVRPAMWISFEQ